MKDQWQVKLDRQRRSKHHACVVASQLPGQQTQRHDLRGEEVTEGRVSQGVQRYRSLVRNLISARSWVPAPVTQWSV